MQEQEEAAATEDADGLADDGSVSPTTPHDNSPTSPDNHFSRPPPPNTLPSGADGNNRTSLGRPGLYALSPILHAAAQQLDETSAVNEAISQTESTCTMLDGSQSKQAKDRGNEQGQPLSHLGKRTLEAAELQVRHAICTVYGSGINLVACGKRFYHPAVL